MYKTNLNIENIACGYNPKLFAEFNSSYYNLTKAKFPNSDLLMEN